MFQTIDEGLEVFKKQLREYYTKEKTLIELKEKLKKEKKPFPQKEKKKMADGAIMLAAQAEVLGLSGSEQIAIINQIRNEVGLKDTGRLFR